MLSSVSSNRFMKTELSKQGREYRKAVNAKVLAFKAANGPHLLGDKRISVHIHLHPPTRAKSDIDNRLKSLLDAMQHAGVYDDDAQIDQLCVSRSDIRKPGEAIVSIWVL